MTGMLQAGERWRVVGADSLQLLPELPDASVDAVVCDPPYGIDFQDQAWDGKTIRQTARAATGSRLSDGQAFERWTTLWASELARVLKPGGHLVAFAAPRTSHRLTCGLEDAGLEIRDTLMWLFGTGMPKSRRLHGGRGTALKPAYEPIILARRAPDGTITQTIRSHGTGALNIDACANREHHHCAARSHAAGGARGRWPANVLLTHAPDCRPGRCANGCPARTLETQHAGASRFLYRPKASRRERDAGCEHLPDQHLDLFPQAKGPHDPQARRVRNAHPTVKPVELMRWLVRLITPPDGLVLDPFCGSGSTGCAAILEQRRFLGIELDPQHVTVARARITHWATDGQHAPRACQGRARRRPPRAGHGTPA